MFHVQFPNKDSPKEASGNEKSSKPRKHHETLKSDDTSNPRGHGRGKGQGRGRYHNRNRGGGPKNNATTKDGGGDDDDSSEIDDDSDDSSSVSGLSVNSDSQGQGGRGRHRGKGSRSNRGRERGGRQDKASRDDEKSSYSSSGNFMDRQLPNPTGSLPNISSLDQSLMSTSREGVNQAKNPQSSKPNLQPNLTNTNRQPQSNAQPPSSSQEVSSINPDEGIKVFRFLLREFDGRTKFGTLMSKKGNLLKGIGHVTAEEWIKRNNKFLAFEINGKVKFVSIFINGARGCFNYNDAGTETCRNKRCQFFHVCRDFLSGYCPRSQCQLTHSFHNHNNFSICSKLGLENYTDEEICKIVVRSTPVACKLYNKSGCKNEECSDIHVCSKFLLQNCNDGNKCKLNHSIKSLEHNIWVLKAFGMEKMEEITLNKTVIVEKEPEKMDVQEEAKVSSDPMKMRGLLPIPNISSLGDTPNAKSSAADTIPPNEWLQVVKLLLKKFNGRTKFGTLMVKKGNLLKGLSEPVILDWLKQNESKFLLFEKNNKVKHISIYLRDAKACFYYRDAGTDSCQNKHCKSFHICKDFLGGFCRHGDRCHFLHSFHQKSNLAVCKELGIEDFSDIEICTIIHRSSPVVCEKYNKIGCEDRDCPDIHVCSKYVLRQCTLEGNCNLLHSITESEHNMWVLSIFRMEKRDEEHIRKHIIVKREPETTTELKLNPECDAKRGRKTGEKVSLSEANESDNLFDQQPPGNTLSGTPLLKQVIVDAHEWINVYKFLLREFEGRTTFNALMMGKGDLLKGLSPENIAHWIQSNKSRFITFSKDSIIRHVSVFYRGAKACFNYRDALTDRCNNENCKFFHICKDFLGGNCTRSRCKFSHSFRTKYNSKVCADLGLDMFTEEQIRIIVFRSIPVVCRKYNTQECTDEDCPDLHVCSKQFQKRCTEGEKCAQNHSVKESDHNMWVLSSFRMEKIPERVIQRLIIIKKEPEHKTLKLSARQTRILDNVDSEPPSPGPETSLQGSIPESDVVEDFPAKLDPKFTHLCENYTWVGSCLKGKTCPQLHHPGRYSYVWYLQIFDEWQEFSFDDNQDIEREFCGLVEEAEFEVVLDAVGGLKLVINFNTMKAKVLDSYGVSIGNSMYQELKVQRLSMPSYVKADGATPLNQYTQWCWYFWNCNEWEPIQPERLQFSLEEKYNDGQEKYYFERDNFRYVMLLHEMSQVNLDTGNHRNVLRRPILLHMPDASKIPQEMSPFLLKELPQSHNHEVPPHWSKLDCFQNFELVELHTSEPEYKTVTDQFYATMDTKKHKLIHIFRVQNPGLWDRFCSTKRLMASRSKCSDGVEEQQLFHGTPDLNSVRGICANSFDFRRAGENVGALYGRGVYFSVKACYSHNYTGSKSDRFMFVAKVLVGKYAMGHKSYTVPPQLEGVMMYDSCVDNVVSPSLFVIFDLSQSYPEYLIQYEYKEAVGGEMISTVQTDIPLQPPRPQTPPSVHQEQSVPLLPDTAYTVMYGNPYDSNQPQTPTHEAFTPVAKSLERGATAQSSTLPVLNLSPTSESFLKTPTYTFSRTETRVSQLPPQTNKENEKCILS